MTARRTAPAGEPTTAGPLTTADVESIVRGYLARLARRYVPVAVGLCLLAVLAIVVPSASPQAGQLTTTDVPAEAGAARDRSRSAAQDSTDDTSLSPAVTSEAGSAGVQSTSGEPGGPVAAGGKAVSGVTCGPGVRQVAWSTYGPLCTPAWSGDNGGATAFGVTGDTITLSYRLATSGESAALQAAAPSTNKTLDQAAYLADLRTYVAYFNTQFELYGRKVVVKDFRGRGDWVAEYQGQNAEGAQADGAQARSLGAFADVSMGRTSSTPAYVRALAGNRVISLGGATLSQATFAALAPYAYSAEPAFDDFGRFFGNLACQRMSQLPASFAGDATLTSRPRVFGIIHPENPDYSPAGDAVASRLKACGDPVANRVSYSINLATLQSQSANAMAQMKAADVSTVICLCDGISSIFLTNAADSQRYNPEWLMVGTSDFTARRWSAQQTSRSITAGGIQRDAQSEAHRVYKLANPDGEPRTPGWTLDLAYQSALLTFTTLQSAGPNLSAATAQRAFFALPDAPAAGDYPAWDFGPNRFTPTGGLPLGYWDPDAPSVIAGGNGAWVPCAGDDGAYRPWEPASAYGAKKTQLRCFGR